MKIILLFCSGFILGIIATFLVLSSIAVENQPTDGLLGLTVFPEKGDCIKTTKGEIEVFQVLKPNMALARIGDILDGLVVLLVNYDGKHYYDNQKIIIPTGKCAKIIGSYRYTTKDDRMKTVPAVVVEE